MAACQDVRTWITSNVLVPVTRFITEAREKCEEFRQSFEEQVTRPVERWISQQEQRCRELPWWNPLRWFCEIVIIVVKVVDWVVETVIKWVVTIVCQIVTFVVGLVVELVLRVVAWVVTFVVCLFTDPLEALKSFRDLWTIVTDVVEDVIDFVGLLLDDVLGILTDVERLLDSLASSLGPLGVLLGLVKGLVSLIRNLVSVVRDLVGAIRDIVMGIITLNLCRILRGGTDLGVGIGRALADTGFAPAFFWAPPVAAGLTVVRVAGAMVAGGRDVVERMQLEGVITGTINNAFGAGTPRATAAIARVGIGGAPMGLPYTAQALRMFLSSNDSVPDLRALHDAGTINLHQLAGYASDCGRLINQPEGQVVYAGSDLRVSYADLETFLALGPGSVPEFHVFAISRQRFRTHLEAARRKAHALGVDLFFPTIGSIRATLPEHLPLNCTTTTPPGDLVQQDLFGTLGRVGAGDDLSRIPAISHFHYVPNAAGSEIFGLASWFRPSADDPSRSGVTYRNRTPDWAFRWVLVHEMGHYWGLNHLNRAGAERGLDEIMYTPTTGISVGGGTVAEYLLLSGEARFTLDDARTAWEWMTTDAAPSLFP
jgi:hypothetical protein